jgi:hypothetical protein
MITMNKRGAKAAGYRALTGRYRLPEERGMLDGVLADLRQGNIGHVLVKDRLGISVWRSFRSGTMRTATIRSGCMRIVAVRRRTRREVMARGPGRRRRRS